MLAQTDSKAYKTNLESAGIKCERQSLDNATMIAYANDGSLDWDMILRSNPCSVNYPTEMSNTFYNNWHNDRADELIDLLLQLRGTPDEIIPYNRCTGHDDLDTTDYGMVVFNYKNGISFAKSNASEIGGFTRRQLVVTGTKKTVELKPFETLVPEGGQVTDRVEYLTEAWFEKGEPSQTPVFDRYDAMLSAFAHMAAGEKENPYTYDYELELYRTILKSCGVDIDK